MDGKASELKDAEPAQRCAEHLQASLHHHKAQDWRSEREELDNALSYVEFAADLLLRRATASMKMGDLYECVADSGRAIKLESDSIPALELRGKGYYMLAEHEMAMNHWRQALKFDPEHKSVKEQYRNLKKIMKRADKGKSLFESGSFADAVR